MLACACRACSKIAHNKCDKGVDHPAVLDLGNIAPCKAILHKHRISETAKCPQQRQIDEHRWETNSSLSTSDHAGDILGSPPPAQFTADHYEPDSPAGFAWA